MISSYKTYSLVSLYFQLLMTFPDEKNMIFTLKQNFNPSPQEGGPLDVSSNIPTMTLNFTRFCPW